MIRQQQWSYLQQQWPSLQQQQWFSLQFVAVVLLKTTLLKNMSATGRSRQPLHLRTPTCPSRPLHHQPHHISEDGIRISHRVLCPAYTVAPTATEYRVYSTDRSCINKLRRKNTTRHAVGTASKVCLLAHAGSIQSTSTAKCRLILYFM